MHYMSNIVPNLPKRPTMENFSIDQTTIDNHLRDSQQNHYFSLKEQYDKNDIYSGGRWDIGRYFSNTALVSLKDLHIKQSFSAETSVIDILTIDIVLEGGVDTLLEHFTIANNDMPKILFGSHTANGHQKRIHHQGEHYKAVGIWITSDALIKNFGLDLDSFPKLTAELLKGKYNRSLLLPITTRIKHCAEEILETEITSKLEEKFIEAKLTEVLYHLIQCLYSPEQ